MDSRVESAAALPFPRPVLRSRRGVPGSSAVTSRKLQLKVFWHWRYDESMPSPTPHDSVQYIYLSVAVGIVSVALLISTYHRYAAYSLKTSHVFGVCSAALEPAGSSRRHGAAYTETLVSQPISVRCRSQGFKASVSAFRACLLVTCRLGVLVRTGEIIVSCTVRRNHLRYCHTVHVLLV
ncbi:hypothetical protein BaRGS_00021193 [Batillaria attramentaria]|uniref:Uncharacterized protein n=1 Tax=Batillaria attramentaria TaxID=370345 RepID=A0ABD0KKG6_9CAEN